MWQGWGGPHLLLPELSEKEDILRARVYHLFKDWTGQLGDGTPLDRLILAMFSHFEEHRDLYALLNERGLIGLLKDVILELCGFRPDQEAKAAYASAFAAYSLYGWVEVWFRRGMRESAAEMAALFEGVGRP